MTTLSIVVPLLNEIEQLPELAAHLHGWQNKGCEVVLTDGGSEDGTGEAAEAKGFTVVRSAPGRARQMNVGAKQSHGDVIVFLHADTRLPDQADQQILAAFANSSKCWGRFNVHIEGKSWLLKPISILINLRSRLTGIATGDQAIFVRRRTFRSMGGFPDQPLMEDIELSKRLRAQSPPVCLSQKVTTSGRRWDTYGLWRTVWLMWRLRWRYWRGESPEQLAREYR